MPKDLRDLMKDEFVGTDKLSINHKSNFEAKLNKELHATNKKNVGFFRIAASFIVLVGLGASLFYFSNSSVQYPNKGFQVESLGSISPELNKIENYYLANINSEISSIEETKENKELLNGYFEKLGELSSDYKELTKELNSEGLNENTINALIDNLQLRLKLLYQLKTQLNELKELKKSENENIQV